MASHIIKKIFSHNTVFIFGGAARKEHYGDLDIAIQGVKNQKKLLSIYTLFEELENILEMLSYRTQTSHDYAMSIAKSVAPKLSPFAVVMGTIITRIDIQKY